MIVQLKNQEILFDHLKSFRYVLLNPISTIESSTEFDILFHAEEVKLLIEQLKYRPDIINVALVNSFHLSQVLLKFEDNRKMVVNFWHQFTYKSLTYLDEKNVMTKRVKASNGCYIPCVEHLFEYWVLKSFLESKGINKSTFQYFNEFHILVQEDLLDYFNIKHGTSFSSIYQLTDFDDTQRVKILKDLKKISSNQFMKKVNISWHNFLSAMRQARII